MISNSFGSYSAGNTIPLSVAYHTESYVSLKVARENSARLQKFFSCGIRKLNPRCIEWLGPDVGISPLPSCKIPSSTKNERNVC
jgi:hypothetical protein